MAEDETVVPASPTNPVAAEVDTELLAAVFASSLDGIIVFDADLVIRRTNEAVARQAQRPLDQVVGHPAEEVVPGWTEQVGDIYRQVRETGVPFHTSAFPFAFKNQPERGVTYWDSRLSPMYGPDGDFRGYLTFLREVTEQKRAEEALRESGERFRGAFDYAAIGMALVAPDGQFIRVNRSLCDILGYTESQLLATTFQAITYSDDLVEDLEQVRLMLASEIDTYQMQKRYYHSRGHVVWVTLSVSLVRDGEGRPLYFISQIQDISKRKRAEETLRESEERLKRAQEIAHLGSWEHDLIHNRLTWSDEVYRLFGLQPQEFDATYEAFIERVHPDDRAALDAGYASSLRENRNGFDTEHRVVCQTGDIRFVHEKCEHVRDTTGKIVRSVGMVHDITERKRAEAEREDFLRTISHDLRQPLTTINGMAEWLASTLTQSGMTHEARMAERILKSGKRMNAMIGDLVESARLEAGVLVMNPEPVDVYSLIQDIAQRVEALEEARRISVEAPDYVPPVATDTDFVERAIVNLLTNALKYSPRESPVLVRIERNDRDAVIFVIDKGAGIPQQDIPYLFDRYFRAKTGKKTEGLGLGLYITRLIVEAHGGKIWVESAVGEGTTFAFTLPLAR